MRDFLHELMMASAMQRAATTSKAVNEFLDFLRHKDRRPVKDAEQPAGYRGGNAGNVVEAEISHAGDDPEDEAAEQQLAEAEGEQRLIDLDDRVEGVFQELSSELARAVRKHDSMNSAHEGHSVIREEFEELWEHVRDDTGDTLGARKEAIQLAAMALRYVLDLNPGNRITGL